MTVAPFVFQRLTLSLSISQGASEMSTNGLTHLFSLTARRLDHVSSN